MKLSKKGTSIAEALVILLLVTSAITGIYTIFIASQKLSIATKNKITAIQIAREGIEAVSNIRDTNVLLFSADLDNCWNTKDYNTSCIGDTGTGLDIEDGLHYITYPNSDNRWILEQKTAPSYSYLDSSYKTNFQVKYDSNGFYTQTGGTAFNPVYTREIMISYINTTGATVDSNDEKMKIESIVRRADLAKDGPYEIKLETILTNWKK